MRLYLERRKRGRQDLQLEGGVVTLSKRSRKVGEGEQTKRDRPNLLSALHAVRTKVAFKNVADSLHSAVEILEHLNVADAFDSWLLKFIRAQRGATRFKHPLFFLLNFSCVSSLSIHSRDV